ncbi:MAG: hypothetical protein IJP86_05655 [Synergistaceae bacterium]|nr:hypothetical protein [Synergistaceae bacterium]
MTQSADDYVHASNTGAFTVSGTDKFTLEIFADFLSSSAGNIISFMAGTSQALSITLEASRILKVSVPNWGITFTGADIPALSAWHHIRLTSNGADLSLWLDGALEGRANLTGTSQLQVTECRIGGCHALLDEFAFRDGDAGAGVPFEPFRLSLDITKAGGFGTGRDGALNLTSANAFTVNTRGRVKEASGVNMQVISWTAANYFKTVNPGDELMFLVTCRNDSFPSTDLAGLYAFRDVVAVNDTYITVDRPITDEFDMTEALASYIVTAYKIPHLSSLSFTGQARFNWDVFAVRSSGDVSWNGATYVEKHDLRRDSIALSHSDLPDRMIPSAGNILIFCGGTFTAPEGARIGHTKAGSITRGPGIGGSTLWDNPIMVGAETLRYAECNILIAAKRLRIDQSALAYGATISSRYSGLCYLAGDFA